MRVDDPPFKCGSCGHEWRDRTLHDPAVADIVDVDAVRIIDRPLDAGNTAADAAQLEREAQRIAKAHEKAQAARQQRAGLRRARIRRWCALAAAVSIPFLVAALIPNHVVKYAPGALPLYKAAGIEVNVRGFEFRNVRQKHLVADGKQVLAVTGQVVNVTKTAAKVPAIRFVLRDQASQPVYAWTLNGVATRALKPSEVTQFVTRIASPPKNASDIEIRFARAGEIGSNAKP